MVLARYPLTYLRSLYKREEHHAPLVGVLDSWVGVVNPDEQVPLSNKFLSFGVISLKDLWFASYKFVSGAGCVSLRSCICLLSSSFRWSSTWRPSSWWPH